MLAGWLLAYAGVGLAEHPLLTEDPGTQATGRSELELGFAGTRRDPAYGGNGTEFAPQFSYGTAAAIDLILRATYVTQSAPGVPAARGIGDSTFDVKWRFVDGPALALAVRAGIDLPTGDAHRGLSAGTAGFHVTGVAGATYDAVDIFANLAYARSRQSIARSNNFAVSAAAVGPRGAWLRSFVEVSAGTSADPTQARYPAVVRTGLMAAVGPGLLMDVGYQAPLNGGAPRHTLLVGLTIRW